MKKTLLSALVVIVLAAQLTGCDGNTPVEQPSESSSVVSDVSEPQDSTSSSEVDSSSEPHSSTVSTTSSISETSEPQSSTVSTTSEPETSSSESNSQPEETSKDDTPKWTETAVSGERYVNTDYISSRVTAIQGSNTVKQYRLNDKVTVVAKTDTGYYKLGDGEFVHGDYLSENEVTVQQPSSGNSNNGGSNTGNGELKHPFTGEKKKPSEGAIAEGLRQIGEEESGIDKLGYEVFGYWVELPSGKFWFCENNGFYYRSMEDALNLKPHANSEAFPYDPSIGNGIHLS